jgi:Na+/H+ antiporter NhaD/arsenite permease-like protein
MPFVILLLCIAILPLVPQAAHFWHKNEAKLAIALLLALMTLVYYWARGYGLTIEGHVSGPGLSTAKALLAHAVLGEYIPFIVLLFSLYTISGGIRLTGDLRATPLTNSGILGIGAVLASVIGTTGASMLLIRPLLQTNRERKHVCHTVIFFIFLVSNIGGCLLPIGDPPLFLGYLYGVPFLWTLRLIFPWAVCVGILLALYFGWDTLRFRSEGREDIAKDASHVEPLRVEGALNFLWLLGVILAVAFLVPGRTFLGCEIKPFVREAAQLLLVVAAWMTTSPKVRQENGFNFLAIGEVAALFIGIFITMQSPIECLRANADTIRQSVNSPWQFFWMTGALSSFLDNAPTYAVYFRMAESMTTPDMVGASVALKGGTYIFQQWLVAVSIGAVFMGANTYIGNGPNFMVKSIAEQSGVRMPSFFGYMFRYSVPILLPIFGIVTLIFFVR